MADGFQWYVSSDEEHFYLAEGCTTREHAIEYGREQYGIDSFWIAEAKQRDFPYRFLFHLDRMFEQAFDAGEEFWGEDQESIFAEKLPPGAEEDLEAMLIETFKAWVEKHGVKLEKPWQFGATRNQEQIEALPEEDDV